MSLHFAQKHVYAGSGEHAWFANLDPKTQLRDKADLGDDDGGSEPSYRALFSRLLVQHVVNKVRIKVPIEASGKRLFKIGGEADLQRQEQEARERHGGARAHCLSTQPTKDQRSETKKYLQKKRERQVWKADCLPLVPAFRRPKLGHSIS